MKNLYLIIIFIVVIGAIFLIGELIISKYKFPNPNLNQPPSPSSTNVTIPANNSTITSSDLATKQIIFQAPLDRAGERVTKKTFGLYVIPQNSPVQPEKFTGYHTGVDFETFPDELNIPVSVHAICSGKLILKKYATGYGGVVVESCTLNNQPITVIYGHLKLASIAKNIGQTLNVGETIGILGAAYSNETNGERKHLHLDIHKGSTINILGYVQTKSALSAWIDPCLYVCHN